MLDVDMSAVWVTICAILCLCHTAEMKEVVWREVGESITIQCRSKPGQLSLSFKRGLREEINIAQLENPDKINKRQREKMEIAGQKSPVVPEMIDRVQFNGTFPNIDFLLKNLSINDTGLYLCLYRKKDLSHTIQVIKGEGSVILVVKENSYARAEAVRSYDEPNLNMPMVYAVPAAALLLGFILGFIIWIKCRTKSSDITVEQTCVATSTNVYVDKEHAEAEAEDEDEAVRVPLANPTETLDTPDHSLKSDEC